MNRVSQDYLYPRISAGDAKTSKISLEELTADKEKFFEIKVKPVTDGNGKFQVLYDQVLHFEDRSDLNLALKVSSDFMRADVHFLFTEVVSNHHYMPQYIFED